MQYCPNCSAYQHDSRAKICARCSFDMSAHQAQLEGDASVEGIDSSKDQTSSSLNFDGKDTCPICDAPTRSIDGTIDIEREGFRISMHGLKLMGGEITKKTVTRYRMEVKGLECSEGHRVFSDVKARVRALCPMCMDETHEYGSSLYSCTRCNKHFSKADWEMPDENTVLEEDGWIKANRIPDNI